MMRTDGFDEDVAKDIMQSLYCKKCGNEDLNVDGKITDMLYVQYYCYCPTCGTKGGAVYSFDGAPAAIESRVIGVNEVDGAEVLKA